MATRVQLSRRARPFLVTRNRGTSPIIQPFRNSRCRTTIGRMTIVRTRETMTPRPQPDALLPLKPVEVLVLTMLAAGDRHVYGIRQDILEHTQGTIELEAGNL